MPKRLIVYTIFILSLAGCETAGPNTETGAVAGGLLGATAGGIVGYQTGHPLGGAAIGGALGAVGGGLIGNSIDQRDQAARATNPYYIPLPQVVSMASQHTPDSVIISEIDRTHSVYHLNSEMITYLRQNNVSDRVIDYMLETGQER